MTGIRRLSGIATGFKNAPAATGMGAFRPEQARYIGKKSISAELVGQLGGKAVALEIHPPTSTSTRRWPARVTVEPAATFGQPRATNGKPLTQAQVRDLLKSLDRAAADTANKPGLRKLLTSIAEDIRNDVPH